ncbi:hypothetical protein CRE_06247 [Caenorhabditis remanei]|uniref:Uncharacterized protein n=1 Tax=Caenorhabditis remanei TaxID=31234 RepID=E3NTN3_CAERE|nr:hypothetical protein CRE_06247 [Caenorhabditis remanei]
MVGNLRLQRWVLSMIRGTYLRTHTNPWDRLVTNACSCCGSSCLGMALENHSEDTCGFVKYLTSEQKLEFAVANTFAFCGYCNSRSVTHTRCDKPRACRNCSEEGHQHYHGVCALNLSPDEFREKVLKMRIQRGRRILWLLENGSLAFQLPNDYIPNAIHEEIRIVLGKGLHIRGVGALNRPAADEFGFIPEQVYRWKAYHGLANREVDHRDLLQPVLFSEGEFDWFKLLEQEARALYKRIRASNWVPFIIRFTLNLADPQFPVEIFALGNDQDYEPKSIKASNDLVQSYKDYIHSHPPQASDLTLSDRVIMDKPIGPLKEDIIRLSSQYVNLRAGTVLTMDDGMETPDLELHKEQQLSNLVRHYVRNTFNCIPDDRYSFGVSRPVFESFETLETPSSRDAQLMRIATWQLILTGQSDPEGVSEDVSEDIILRYIRYLVDCGISLSAFPRCYVRLACGTFGASSKGVFILVPSIRYFRDPVMVQVVTSWNAAERAQFAISNAPINSFPYSEDTRNPVGGGKTENEEEARESEIQAVLHSLDSDRRVLGYRVHLPSLEVVDLFLVYPFPEHKSQIIRRIQQLQFTMTGSSELTMHLDECQASQLGQYYEFWKASLLAIRCLINTEATAPMRMSECIFDLLHGGKTSFDLALPSMRAYRWEAHGWWLLWIDKTLIPQLRRISGIDCGCPHHKFSPRSPEGQI